MRLLTLYYLTFLLAGCSSPATLDEGPWHGRDLLASDPPWTKVLLDAGTGLEVSKAFDYNDSVSWDWFVEERVALDFNVHIHANDPVSYPLMLRSVEHTGNLTADVDGNYSLDWKNPGTHAVTLHVRVPLDYRGGMYSLHHPAQHEKEPGDSA